MNDHSLYLLTCLVAMEVIIRSRLLFRTSEIIRVGRKSSSVLVSKSISDCWKEKALVAYSVIIMKQSSFVLMVLCGILFFFWVSSFVSPAIPIIALSVGGIAEATIFVLVYLKIRKVYFEK